MLKKTMLAGMFFLFLGVAGAYAQFPAEGINYQAVARNAQGNVISTPITVRISIYSGSPTGTLQYQETHNASPNSYGLFNISIGQGVYVSGAVNTFAAINWGTSAHFSKTEINTGSGFIDMGTSQLLAVPYALYAKNSGNGSSGGSYTAGAGIGIANNIISANDVSATNEIQSLSLSGSVLSISGGNNVTLPTGSGTSYTAGSGIGITGGVISATDNSITNEIQSLTISGSTLSISGGNSITLPSGSGSGGTLDQAYDFGGAGAGKTITADSGPVTINGSGAGAANIGLLVAHSGTGTAAVGVNFSGTGNGIQAISSNAANSFATIQASTNSSTTTNSAVFGQSTGAARAVAGQVEASATADVAVRGLNLRTTGGIGVEGAGFNGVSGTTSQVAGVAVYGSNSSTGATGGAGSLGIGTYGVGFNGVYGQTTNVSLGYAGYFTADIGVEGAGYALGGWVNASDRRLKSNIVPIANALDKIMMLQGTHYTITTKASGPVSLDGKKSEPITKSREQYGVIAQEIEKIFPEMVSEKAIFANQGDNTVYKTVDYIQIVPVLIEAIKELKLEVEALKAQIKE